MDQNFEYQSGRIRDYTKKQQNVIYDNMNFQHRLSRNRRRWRSTNWRGNTRQGGRTSWKSIQWSGGWRRAKATRCAVVNPLTPLTCRRTDEFNVQVSTGSNDWVGEFAHSTERSDFRTGSVLSIMDTNVIVRTVLRPWRDRRQNSWICAVQVIKIWEMDINTNLLFLFSIYIKLTKFKTPIVSMLTVNNYIYNS